MSRFLWLMAVTAVAVLILSAALPSVVLAHERREVGKYLLVVGWIIEPAYVGQKNGVDLRITNSETTQPVEGLEQTLKVEVTFGGQRREFPLRTIFRDPGHYTADIVPMREGDYRFRFFGTIDGTQINETFDSADGRFHGAEEIEAIQFPQTSVSAEESLAAQAAEQRITAAQNTAAASQTYGIAGIVVGALGLLVGGLALMRSRSPS